ncbi:hypothetical protein VTI74DRAFT_8210 [Chaetomium olivicolor]
MDVSSPVKRRVLGALDPNTCSSPKKARQGLKPAVAVQPSPVKMKPVALWVVGSPESRKRSSPAPSPTSASVESKAGEKENEDEVEPAAKRQRVEGGEQEGDKSQLLRVEVNPHSPPPSSASTTRSIPSTTRHRSASPETPSVFDTSAVDNTQMTILTEPDTPASAAVPAVAAPPQPQVQVQPPRPRVRLTREQAREKAEILRLRLGLASYKVHTGQTDVPLERLELRRVSRAGYARTGSIPSSHSHPPTAAARPQHLSTLASTASTWNSFQLPASSQGSASSAGAGRNRRPLPGAPVRRASSTSSAASVTVRSVVSGEHGGRAESRPATATRAESGLSVGSRSGGGGTEESGEQQHRQAEDVGGDARRYSSEESAAPQQRLCSPPAAAAGAAASCRRGSADADQENGGEKGEDDDGRRGGAASGLLSLARS